MIAIQHNILASLISFISNELPSVSGKYGIPSVSVDILPAYPRDLTDFRKPSIIVQEINTVSRSIGMGGTLGQYEDPDTGRIYDVVGKLYDVIYQINIDCDNNTDLGLFTGAMCDGIFGKAIHGEYGDDGELVNGIPLLDHVSGTMAEVGTIKMDNKYNTTSLSVNENNDYINAIRIDLMVIQSIIDTSQPMVDLSKPIKWSQTVKL